MMKYINRLNMHSIDFQNRFSQVSYEGKIIEFSICFSRNQFIYGIVVSHVSLSEIFRCKEICLSLKDLET